MTSIIDFRNARYQGQIKNNLPHGIGIIIDQYFLFCLAEWDKGNINGSCFIVFPDGKIFYGSVKNQEPIGLNTYHLKDKCQIIKNLSQNGQITQHNIAVLLPTLKLILEVEGQSQDNLRIISQQNYDQNKVLDIQKCIEKIINYKFSDRQLSHYLSVQNFLNRNFVLKYNQLLQITYVSGQKTSKQIFVSFKGESLGVKLQICQKQQELTNIHNDGHTYVVRSIGYYSQQGLLVGFGMKTIDTLIKGKYKQQGIYSMSQTIKRYEEGSRRPSQCPIIFFNYLRRSFQFVNTFVDIYYLYHIQQQCINMNFNIKQNQTRRHAQIILENPKQLTFQQQKMIDLGRQKLGRSSRIVKNKFQKKGSIFDEQLKSRTKNFQKSEHQQKLNQVLMKTKQEIYRSVSKRKISGSKTPNKQITASQIKAIRPLISMGLSSDGKSIDSGNRQSVSPAKNNFVDTKAKNLFPKFTNNTQPTTTPAYRSNKTPQKHLNSYNQFSQYSPQENYKKQQVSTKTPTKKYNYLDMVQENYQSNKSGNYSGGCNKNYDYNSNDIKGRNKGSYGRQLNSDLQSLRQNRQIHHQRQASKYDLSKKYNPHEYLQQKQQSSSPFRVNNRVSGTIGIGRTQINNNRITNENNRSPDSGGRYNQNSYVQNTERQRINQIKRQRQIETQRIKYKMQQQQKMRKDPIYANLHLKKLQLYDIPQQRHQDDSITSTQKQLIQYYNQKNNVQSRKNLLLDNDDDYLQRRQPKREHHLYQKHADINDSLDNKNRGQPINSNVSPLKKKNNARQQVSPIKTTPIKQISPFKSKSSANSSYAANNTFGGSKNNSYGELDRPDVQTGVSSRGVRNAQIEKSPIKAGGAIRSNKKPLFTKNQFE